MNLGIIGTAGRGQDGYELPSRWETMAMVADSFLEIYQPDRLVSGGAAWSDSLATEMFLHNKGLGYDLFLPCRFDKNKFASKTAGIADTANFYHKEFSKAINKDSLEEIGTAIRDLRCDTVYRSGFKERNTDIAEKSDILLAFTFGEGKKLKDGGTLDTMNKYLSLKKKNAFHFCLNVERLYRLS